MRFSIVLSTSPTKFDAVAFRSNFRENVARIAGLGYDGVELAIRDPSLLDPSSLEQSLQRYNLAVPAIGTGQAYGEEKLSFTDVDKEVRRAAIARVKEHIRLGARLQAIVILGLIRGVIPPAVERSQAIGWLVDALRECVDVATKYNVRLALEPISRGETNLINTVEEGVALLSHVGAGAQARQGDVIGLLPDTYHMYREESSIEASLRRAAPWIVHFHVADSNRRYPGAGTLDFGRILALLRDELTYQGWVSAEILAEPTADIAAKRALSHLRACLERENTPDKSSIVGGKR